MATLKYTTAHSLDKANGRHPFVHYAKVLKKNRKQVATELQGTVVEFGDGTFYIDAVLTNYKGESGDVQADSGDIIFTVGKSTRRQLLSKEAFKKRFPQIKP